MTLAKNTAEPLTIVHTPEAGRRYVTAVGRGSRMRVAELARLSLLELQYASRGPTVVATRVTFVGGRSVTRQVNPFVFGHARSFQCQA